MNFTIGFRRANQQDIAFLIKLRKASMTKHLLQAGIVMSDEQHLARITEYFSDSHIILRDQEAIGLLKLGVLKQSLHIRQFQLSPEFHQQGIGTKVLALVKRKAHALSLPVTLNVLLENPAKTLYLRHGFVISGENDLEFQMICSTNNI